MISELRHIIVCGSVLSFSNNSKSRIFNKNYSLNDLP